ncbi:MAG: hypothetical protein AAF531_08460 [Actinomycetota bacterium]
MTVRMRQSLPAIAVLAVGVLVAAGLLYLQAGTSRFTDQSAERTAPTSESPVVEADEDTAAETADSGSPSIAPAEAVVLDEVSDGDHWLGRGTMTSTSIEIFWAPVEAADSYRIYRVDNVSGFDSASIPLTADELRYEGTDTTYVDTSVDRGSFYTYIMEVQVGEEILARRWAQTMAEDDTVPPEPITGLSGERTDEGILLQWDPTDDDVEFSSYSVFLVEEEQLTYLGGGGDIEAVAFIDRDPADGPVTYAVQAVDFHDNRTEAVTITVDAS